MVATILAACSFEVDILPTKPYSTIGIIKDKAGISIKWANSVFNKIFNPFLFSSKGLDNAVISTSTIKVNSGFLMVVPIRIKASLAAD